MQQTSGLTHTLEQLVNSSDDFDWNNQNGKGIVERRELPSLAGQALLSAKREIQRLNDMLCPADPKFIAKSLAALKARYYQKPDLSQALIEQLIKEDVQDAMQYPGYFFSIACKVWREKGNKFSPNSVGELMKGIGDSINLIKIRKFRLEALINSSK